jgi:hypothetical protein
MIQHLASVEARCRIQSAGCANGPGPVARPRAAKAGSVFTFNENRWLRIATSLYSCFSGASDVPSTMRELMLMKIVRPDQITNGFVVRSDKAYPVIEVGYQRHIATIKSWLDQLENLLPIGRSGMFKYNNQDHAMATGLLAARTALGVQRFDPWLINIDAEYHEGAPAMPPRLSSAAMTRGL